MLKIQSLRSSVSLRMIQLNGKGKEQVRKGFWTQMEFLQAKGFQKHTESTPILSNTTISPGRPFEQLTEDKNWIWVPNQQDLGCWRSRTWELENLCSVLSSLMKLLRLSRRAIFSLCTLQRGHKNIGLPSSIAVKVNEDCTYNNIYLGLLHSRGDV